MQKGRAATTARPLHKQRTSTMELIAHVLEYYRTNLAWADAADWPHIHLRERVRHYETVNGHQSRDDTRKRQTDLEDLIDRNHQRKHRLRHYILQAIDEFARVELELDEQRGWKDNDLPRLF